MEPDTKRLKLENEVVPEKEQTGWFDLPYEIRGMIIETMDTPSKCKFSRCSKQCDKEIGMSRNFIESVEMRVPFPRPSKNVCIAVKSQGFYLRLNIWGKCVNIAIGGRENAEGYFSNLRPPIKEWEIKEEGEIESNVARYFDNIMRHASNSSMNLIIELEHFPYDKTSIRHLKKLKKLGLYKNEKGLDLIECGFIDIEQLSKIPERVKLSGVRFNLEQTLKLRADSIALEQLGMTSEELNQYLKLWADGQLHSNFKQLQIGLIGQELDKKKVIEGLELSHFVDECDSNEKVRFKLRSLSNPDVMVRVRFNIYFFIMCVDKYAPELTQEELEEKWEGRDILLRMEPVAKRSKLKKEDCIEEKTTGWFDLPSNIRNKIIEMMDTPSKGKFSRISKKCYEEVGMSKNYIDEISIQNPWNSNVNFVVKYGDFQSKVFVYSYKSKIHTRTGTREVGEEPYVNQKDLVVRYFNNILKNSSKSQMSLIIDWYEFPFEKTSIRHLKELQRLVSYSSINNVDLVECGFLEMEQLYKIPKVVKLSGVRFNLEKLLQMKAEVIVLDSIEITSEEVNQYLKLWADGQLHSNFKTLQFMMNGKVMEKETIVEGLELLPMVDTTDSDQCKLCSKLRSLANPDIMARIRLTYEFFLIEIDKFTLELTDEEKKLLREREDRAKRIEDFLKMMKESTKNHR